MNVKVVPAKRAIVPTRRHYHLPQRQRPDSWDGWVRDKQSRHSRMEWGFAALVGVAAIVGLIVWRTA